jgi:hypothetical protein
MCWLIKRTANREAATLKDMGDEASNPVRITFARFRRVMLQLNGVVNLVK